MLYSYLVAGLGLFYVNYWDYYHNHGFVHVEIDKGILRGWNSTTFKGESYFNFRGIPYAKPPINDLRFKAPLEESAWEGVRDAVSYGSVCPHIDMVFDILRGDEDCLFLNVYTPEIGAKRLPVMVWIHGGMFIIGSGNDELWGPDYFMGSGVVLVTINYRLGALGFLSTEDDGAPGNAGLKDQVAALKWVRRNIAKFGGDPENVTIFGSSTGASCVEFHILSPMSKGLFSKAILQSGSALNSWALSENAAKATVILAKRLGAKNVTGDPAGALKFLKTTPYHKIVRVQGLLKTPEKKKSHIGFTFSPSVEKGVKSEEVFLPYSPAKILESGNYNKIPMIIGFTSHEGYFHMSELEQPEVMKEVIENTERYIPLNIKNNRMRKQLAQSIREFYFDNQPIGMGNISNLVNLYSDVFFVSGITRSMKSYLKTTNNSIYSYVFTHDDPIMNIVKILLHIDRPGAVHGDELGYLFHQNIRFWITPEVGSRNEYVVNTMICLWTNFAKYGNPTPAGDPLDWKPVTTEKYNYLNISGSSIEVDENPYPERIKFWDKVYNETAFSPHTRICYSKKTNNICSKTN